MASVTSRSSEENLVSPLSSQAAKPESQAGKCELVIIDTVHEDPQTTLSLPIDLESAIADRTDELTAAEKRKAEKLGEQANKAFRKSVSQVFSLAKIIKKAHDLYSCKGCKSGFMPWRNKYLPDLKDSTTNRYIKIAQRFPTLNPSTVEQFELTALYELAALKLDDHQPLRKAIELADAGELVTAKTARELIKKHSKYLVRGKSQAKEVEKFKTSHGLVKVAPIKGEIDARQALQEALGMLNVD